jgi:hypothetical protein
VALNKSMLLSGGCSTKNIYIFFFALFSRKEATLKYKTQPCLNLKTKYTFFFGRRRLAGCCLHCLRRRWWISIKVDQGF